MYSTATVSVDKGRELRKATTMLAEKNNNNIVLKDSLKDHRQCILVTETSSDYRIRM